MGFGPTTTTLATSCSTTELHPLGTTRGRPAHSVYPILPETLPVSSANCTSATSSGMCAASCSDSWSWRMSRWLGGSQGACRRTPPGCCGPGAAVFGGQNAAWGQTPTRLWPTDGASRRPTAAGKRAGRYGGCAHRPFRSRPTKPPNSLQATHPATPRRTPRLPWPASARHPPLRRHRRLRPHAHRV